MTEAEAKERLERMTSAATAPLLEEAEVIDLLEMAKRADSEGRAPSDDDWEPTFDLIPSAAEGWRWKAGKVVPRFDATLDGATLRRQQIYANCLKQADLYARRIIGSIPIGTPTSAAVETDNFL